MRKKTKIIATIGPSSEDVETLTKLHEAGVNIIRVNFSHGDYREHEGKIDRWNEIISDPDKNGAIMADLAGPEVRTGKLDAPRSFALGDKITLTTDEALSGEALHINYAGLPGDVSVSDRVLIDDGLVSFTISDITETDVIGEVTQAGTITKGGRGVNVPGVRLSLPVLTEKDNADLEFSLKKDVDFVAVSFVKTAADIELVREKLAEHKAEDTQIVAKIETQSAVDDIDNIIATTDCIMVARGDLAVEVGLENVPIIQKEIIKKCNAAGVPVITATQMLESMTSAPTPTRAEASDVANAIFDGTDAIMLSGETALGKYPIETVSVMTSIAQKVEFGYHRVHTSDLHGHALPVDALTASVVSVADDIKAKAIVAFTESGYTARMLSRYRPNQDIIVFSTTQKVHRQMSMLYGCVALELGVDPGINIDTAVTGIKEALLETGKFKIGDMVVVAAGVTSSAEKLGTNTLLIAEL